MISNANSIRLALAGKLPDNDHPYSWAAIINGYDPAELPNCPNAIIRGYLSKQPREAFGIPGVKVTHIWCDDPTDAERVAALARIPHIATNAQQLIGQVDAVLIPTDKGHEHVERARPFIEADISVFVDKPLVDNPADLQTFVDWVRADKRVMSSSALRYAVEFETLRQRLADIGRLRFVTMTMAKRWERYGIHALEGVYPFLTPGRWLDATTVTHSKGDTVLLRHGDDVTVAIAVIDDLAGSMGCLSLYGTEGHLGATFADSFTAFKRQLEAFVQYLRTGVAPVPFEQTVELMKLLIAALRSRELGGQTVPIT